MQKNNTDAENTRGISGRLLRREQRMAEVLAMRQDDLTLVLANIHDPHNVSAIYRSCDAFGVSSVHLLYTHAAFPRLGSKTSASARKWVETVRHNSPQELQAALKKANFKIFATTFSRNALPLHKCSFIEPCAIIMGNEHNGVESDLIALSDCELYIPMRGMIQSLNVSVAAAVILAEAARQREAAGFYSKNAENCQNFQERLDEWLKK